jgi:type I restriction enzyme S subunit
MTRLSLNSSRKTKITPAGEIPVDWGCVRFREIVSDAAYGLSLPTDHSGNVTILKMNSISNGKLSVHDLDSVTCTDSEIEQYSIKRGDILFNRTNSFDLVGKTAVVSKDARIVFASYLVRYRVTDKAVPEFIGYWFNYEKVQRRLKELATVGVSQSNINPTRLQHDLHVPLPPLPEQQKIADILGTWDEALEKLDALIAAKARRKQALMQQLLTGHRRLPGSSAPVKFIRASEIFTNRTERNNRGAPILSVTQDQGVVVRDTLERKIAHDIETNDTYKVVHPGDYIISLRSFQGGLEYSEILGAVSPAYHVIHPIKEIDREFYRHYFKSADFVSRLAVAVIGIRDGKQISFTDFGFIKLPHPHIEDQKRIGQLLSTADAELRLLRQQRTALDHQKRGLMQQLLTGCIRVAT